MLKMHICPIWNIWMLEHITKTPLRNSPSYFQLLYWTHHSGISTPLERFERTASQQNQEQSLLLSKTAWAFPQFRKQLALLFGDLKARLPAITASMPNDSERSVSPTSAQTAQRCTWQSRKHCNILLQCKWPLPLGSTCSGTMMVRSHKKCQDRFFKQQHRNLGKTYACTATTYGEKNPNS